MSFRRGEVVTHWARRSLVVEWAGEAVVIDAPVGIAARLRALGVMPRVRTIVLTSGRVGAIGGLVELLVALMPARRAPLSILFALGEERAPTLVEAWSRCWPDAYPLALDGLRAGEALGDGPFEVATVSLDAGEPDWQAGQVVPTVAMGVAVRVGGVRVVWVPDARPSPAVTRFVSGAHLAAVEVGVTGWPTSDASWRMSRTEAVALSTGADVTWLVGDDGGFVADEVAS
jgi:hypothetical protein